MTRANGKKFVPVISRISPRADADFIAAAKNAWPAFSARLRAAEAGAASLAQLADDYRAKAAQYERDWYNAKSEFGAAMAKRSAKVGQLTAALHGLVAAVTARGGDCPSCGVDDSELCAPDCAVNAARAALGEP